MKLKSFSTLLIMLLLTYSPVLIVSTAVSSCKVTFQPTYDAAVFSQIKVVQSLTQKLFKEIAESPDKSYAAFAEKYQMVSAQISSLATIEVARLKSKLQQQQVEQLSKLFSKYENYHKIKGVLNEAEAKLYSSYLDAILKSIKNAEQNLPK